MKYLVIIVFVVFWINTVFNYFVLSPCEQQLKRTQSRYQTISHELKQDTRVSLVRDLKQFYTTEMPQLSEHDDEILSLSIEKRLDVLIPSIKVASVRALLYLAKVVVIGASSSRAFQSRHSAQYGVLVPITIQITYPEVHQWSYFYFARLVQQLTQYEHLILSSLDMSKSTIRASFIVYGFTTD